MLALGSSAKAWTGSISAGLLAEYVKPSIDYGIGIGMRQLEAATGVPVPESMASGLGALLLVAIIWPIIHFIPNSGGKNDPTQNAGA